MADLAKDWSDEPATRTRGGLLEKVPYGRFAKAFEDAVRAQALGKPGEPVKTPQGYCFIQVEARTPAVPADFEKVKAAVRQQMLPGRKTAAVQAYLDQVKKDVGFQEAKPSA